MSAPSDSRNEHVQVMWQPKIDGRTHDVPIDVITNSSSPDVHFYGGLGEEMHANARAVKNLGDLDIKAAGVILPFHYLEPTQANIERTVIEAPHEVARQLSEKAYKPAGSKTNLIGRSQGGGVALLTASEAPELFNAIGALAPAGLTNKFLGEKISDREKQFLWRLLVRNNTRPEQLPIPGSGNPTAAYEIGKRAIDDMRAQRLEPKLRYALSLEDLPEKTKILSADHPIRIFAGEKDPVFKLSELLNVLGAVGLEHVVERIPGSHSAALTRPGKRQLAIVADWLKSVM